VAERTEEPGVATGLAWTEAGGDILFVEATRMAGKGNLVLTGQLGNVMPAGAIPKDGPSAGAAMLIAMVSLFTGRRVRGDVAMTGEITLRGSVLPVGGIKEKVLAPHRAGIKRVILPERNRKDLIDVPAEVQRDLEIRFARRVEEALELALEVEAVVELHVPPTAPASAPV
jgi:ATP-dependent Lon protease